MFPISKGERAHVDGRSGHHGPHSSAGSTLASSPMSNRSGPVHGTFPGSSSKHRGYFHEDSKPKNGHLTDGAGTTDDSHDPPSSTQSCQYSAEEDCDEDDPIFF